MSSHKKRLVISLSKNLAEKKGIRVLIEGRLMLNR